jgi:hypothetical protein
MFLRELNCIWSCIGRKFLFLRMGHVKYKKNPSFCVDFKNINIPYGADKMHLKMYFRITGFCLEKFFKPPFFWENFFRCSLSLRHVYIFEIYTKRRIFWCLTQPTFGKKILNPYYVEPNLTRPTRSSVSSWILT